MPTSLYVIEKMNFNGYEAFFLMVSTNKLIWGKSKRFVPAMAQYINDKKNKYVKLSKFPTQLNAENFFYFIHAQDRTHLDEFVRTHPNIQSYIDKLKDYFKSIK